jgi:hypothetical protein
VANLHEAGGLAERLGLQLRVGVLHLQCTLAGQNGRLYKIIVDVIYKYMDVT